LRGKLFKEKKRENAKNKKRGADKEKGRKKWEDVTTDSRCRRQEILSSVMKEPWVMLKMIFVCASVFQLSKQNKRISVAFSPQGNYTD
jgi:hypothetical protein